MRGLTQKLASDKNVLSAKLQLRPFALQFDFANSKLQKDITILYNTPFWPILRISGFTWGDHSTKKFPRVSPFVVFTEINYLTLVSGHLNQWFWRDFDSKFGVFWAISGFRVGLHMVPNRRTEEKERERGVEFQLLFLSFSLRFFGSEP